MRENLENTRFHESKQTNTSLRGWSIDNWYFERETGARASSGDAARCTINYSLAENVWEAFAADFRKKTDFIL